MVRVFPLVLIDRVRTSGVKKWPATVEALQFILDDAVFTNPAERVALYMRLSWQETQPTGNEPLNSPVWPYTDGPNEWAGGAKARDGSPVSVTLGPFRKVINGVEVTSNPKWVQFRAVPVAGTPTVGLFAEVEELG